MTWTIFFILVALLWLIATFVLSGPDLSRYDSFVGEHFDDHPDDASATKELLSTIGEVRKTVIKSYRF